MTAAVAGRCDHSGTAGSFRAVLFDLDDTLVPQQVWLQGAFQAVADALAAIDPAADRAAVRTALADAAAAGSARGGVIDRALQAIGSSVPVAPLVEAFLSFRAARLDPYPGVPAMLDHLRQRVPLGLVTDGNPDVQRAKLAAAGLADAFDTVICSDEFGRAYRKPHPRPFLAALERLQVPPAAAVFVGDRPDTDIAGAVAVGLATVRVRTGEYGALPCAVGPSTTVADAVAAGRWVGERLGRGSARPGRST